LKTRISKTMGAAAGIAAIAMSIPLAINAYANTVQLRSMVIRGRRSGWGHGLWCERLAAHLRTLRLTTRGLARRRRLGLIRWVSLVIAHCHRVAIASWL
jgi:hypothetical protein